MVLDNACHWFCECLTFIWWIVYGLYCHGLIFVAEWSVESVVRLCLLRVNVSRVVYVCWNLILTVRKSRWRNNTCISWTNWVGSSISDNLNQHFNSEDNTFTRTLLMQINARLDEVKTAVNSVSTSVQFLSSKFNLKCNLKGNYVEK